VKLAFQLIADFPSQVRVDAENPWPGLIPFSEADRAYFHGRRQETDELLRLVFRQRLSVLFGLSGLGKSSLLLAGLFPALRREGVFPVYVRLDFSIAELDLTNQVNEALLREAAKAGIETPPAQADDTLWRYLHRVNADFWDARNRPVVPLLVFDQFEEIFTLGQADGVRRKAVENFLDQLADLAEGRPPAQLRSRLDEHPEEAADFSFDRHNYKILLSVREDFLADLEGLRQRMGDVALNRMRLQRMNGHEALQVVNQAPQLIDPSVGDRIVRFVAADQNNLALDKLEVEPALLSVVCRELNAKRQQRNEQKITANLLEGSKDEVLSDFYERSVADLGSEVRTFVEDRLLTLSGYRDSVALENVLAEVSRASLDQLIARRLLRIEERGGTQRIELTHDRLTAVVRGSRDKRKDTEEKQRARKALQEAQQQREDSNRREARALQDLRNSRIRSALFGIVALVAVGAAIWATMEQRIAAQATSEGLCASAQDAVRKGHWLTGLALAGKALRLDPKSTTAQGWVLSILQEQGRAPSAIIPTDGSTMCQFDSDGNRVLAAETSNSVVVWSAFNGKRIGRPIEHSDAITTAEFSSDGRRIITASNDGTARVSDVETGRRISELKPHGGQIESAEFCADGRRVFTITADEARLWDTESGQPISEPLKNDSPGKASLSPDERQIVTVPNNVALLTDVETGKLNYTLAMQDEDIRSASFSPDGRRLMLATKNQAYVWDLSTMKRVGPLTFQKSDYMPDTFFSPDGLRVFSINAKSKEVFIWTADGGKAVGKLPCASSVEPESAGCTVSFSPDSRHILVVASHSVSLWDSETLRRISQQVVGNAADSLSAIFTPEGRVLTVVHNGAYLWNAELTKQIEVPMLQNQAIRSLSFSHQGQFALTTSEDHTARLWDAKSWIPIGHVMAHDGELLSAQFSPDDSKIVTVSSDRSARVWNWEDVRLSPVSLSNDKSVEFWTASEDGRRVLIVTDDHRAQLWDAGRRKLIGPPLAHEEPIRAAGFCLNGRRFLTVAAHRSGDSERLVEAESGWARHCHGERERSASLEC